MSNTETSTYLPVSTSSLNDGVQRKYKFDNGYGASVVRHSSSYGHESGLWELGVLGLSEEQVQATLAQIAALPKPVQS